MLPTSRVTRRAPRRPPGGGATRLRAGAVLVVATVTAAGCSLPALDAPGEELDPVEEPLAVSTPDPSRAVLVAELEDLTTTVAVARDAFAVAVEDADGGAVADALAALVEDAPGSGEVPDDGPLFPAVSGDRNAEVDGDDALTPLLTAAREGGAIGSRVVDVLRDPVAGDLGGWERDAAGVLEQIDDAVAEAGPLAVEDADPVVLGLPGLGPQAVAWAQLADGAQSDEAMAAYAGRGLVTVEVILTSLDGLDLETSP